MSQGAERRWTIAMRMSGAKVKRGLRMKLNQSINGREEYGGERKKEEKTEN